LGIAIFLCVQVVCYVPLKKFQQGLQFYFKSHLHRRSTHKVMGPQSCRSSNCENFGTPTWEPRTKWHLGASPWLVTKYTIRRKVVASSKFGPWWVLWICGYLWLVHAPKCYNYALTNLWFDLCRSVWVNELLFDLPSPILELSHTPLPLKCYELKNVPQLFLFPLSLSLSS
jgi:hypothetical protein